jgi:transposase
MSFIAQNTDLYNKALKERAGYICPDCGNVTEFKEYYDEYTLVMQDVDTGEVTETMNSQVKGLREVVCTVCGCNNARLCDKGLIERKE